MARTGKNVGKGRVKSARKPPAKAGRRVTGKATGGAKPPRATPVKLRRNAGLSAAELRHFRELLLAKRAALVGDVTSMANEALGKNRQDASGDLSNMPIHMADIGSDNYEQEFTLGLLESEQALLREIDAALARMDKGTYGVCLGTGRLIGKDRMEAKPWAKYCIEYTRLVEKGMAPEIEASSTEHGAF